MTEVSEDVCHRKFQFRAPWVSNFEYENEAMASVTSAMRHTEAARLAVRVRLSLTAT